jgi:hypothetical protein
MSAGAAQPITKFHVRSVFSITSFCGLYAMCPPGARCAGCRRHVWHEYVWRWRYSPPRRRRAVMPRRRAPGRAVMPGRQPPRRNAPRHRLAVIPGRQARRRNAPRRCPPRRARAVHRSWPSSRCAARGSSSTTPPTGSCVRPCRAARPDARRQPAFSAFSRRTPTITPTCTTPGCHTCTASRGRASPCMAVLCRGIRRQTAVSGCPTTSPAACST